MIINIRDLRLECIIGVYEHERHATQMLIAQVELTLDNSAARFTDKLEDTVDYAALETCLIKIATENQPQLIERLAQLLLDGCLNFDSRIARVQIELEKPSCLKQGRSAIVKLASHG